MRLIRCISSSVVLFTRGSGPDAAVEGKCEQQLNLRLSINKFRSHKFKRQLINFITHIRPRGPNTRKFLQKNTLTYHSFSSQNDALCKVNNRRWRDCWRVPFTMSSRTLDRLNGDMKIEEFPERAVKGVSMELKVTSIVDNLLGGVTKLCNMNSSQFVIARLCLTTQ